MPSVIEMLPLTSDNLLLLWDGVAMVSELGPKTTVLTEWNRHCHPLYVYLEVSSIVFKGVHSQE